MESKVFEVRDRGTFIPVLATKLGSDDFQETWLLSKSGYGFSRDSQSCYVLLCQLQGNRCNYDPYSWDSATYSVAHAYIREHFDDMLPGAVVDVEYVRGERSAPRISEREKQLSGSFSDLP